ncbi:MAG: CDP-diacylglycerol--serine O-phosphatidyltransferase [Desulfosudaceae bacterium]
MKKDRTEKKRLRKGIYVLPNIFTTLNLFCGFAAVIASIEGAFMKSALLIVGAMAFDTLDGKVARATRTTSQFGVEYDSLADLISFGLAPGIMMYLWVLQPLGKFGWIAALVFLACGALRLARFNTHVDTADSSVFTGLPIPAAAGMLAAIVLLLNQIGVPARSVTGLIYLIPAMMYLLSFLMVSSIPYASFKKMPAFLVKAKSFNLLVTAVLMMVLIIQEPAVTVFAVILLYTLSGPLGTIRRHLTGHHRYHADQPDDNDQPPPDIEEQSTYHI